MGHIPRKVTKPGEMIAEVEAYLERTVWEGDDKYPLRLSDE